MAKTPPRRLPLSRKILFCAVILTGMVGCALGAAELLARFTVPLKVPWMRFWPRGYYVPAAGCHYQPAVNFPPTCMHGADPKLRNLCYSNSLGMHDVEPPAASAAQLRILCLGCSFTEGYWLNSRSQPWPRRLEGILNRGEGSATSATVVVMNAGVVGYNTFQQVAHGAGLSGAARADVWLMAYLGGKLGMWARNDYGPEGLYRLRWGLLWDVDHLSALRGGRGALSLWLMDTSYYWRWFCLTRTNWSPAVRKEDRTAYHHDYPKASWDALSAFQREAARSGVAPVLVYLPDLEEMGDLLQNRFDPEKAIIPLKLAEMCGQLKIPFIDLRAAMAGSARELKPGQFPAAWRASAADPHYNAECNTVFARNLAERIRPLLAGWKRRTP